MQGVETKSGPYNLMQTCLHKKILMRFIVLLPRLLFTDISCYCSSLSLEKDAAADKGDNILIVKYI